MTRYNLFYCIHKSLRALLYDAGMLLQRTDFAVKEEAKEAIGRLQFAVKLFERSHQSEDIFVLSAIADYEPGVVDSFGQEHQGVCQRGKKLELLLGNSKDLSLPSDKVVTDSEIRDRFEEFMQFNIQHMAREEKVIAPLLWRYYTDAELQKMACKILSGGEPDLQLYFFRWLLSVLNDNDFVRWLKEVKSASPEEDFYRLMKAAEAGLQPRRWSLLQNELPACAMVA